MGSKALKITATLAASMILLAGCSSSDADPSGQMPSDQNHQQATAVPSEQAAESDGEQGTSTNAAMTKAQVVAATGAVMAAQLGFPSSRVITDAELKELAVPPTDTLKDVVVLPAQCSAPVDALNWSPAQLGTEVARTDFTNQAQNIAGSIEVAQVSDRTKLEEHYKTVLQIRTECKTVKLNGLEYMQTLKFSSPGISGVQSQLYYSRTGDAANKRDSLVLLADKGDYVVMVSFMSADPLSTDEFNQVAKTILDTAVAQL